MAEVSDATIKLNCLKLAVDLAKGLVVNKEDVKPVTKELTQALYEIIQEI